MPAPDPDLHFFDWIAMRDEGLARLDKKYGLNSSYAVGPACYDWREIERQINILMDLPRPEVDSEGVRHQKGVPGLVFDQYLNAKAEIFLSCCWAEKVRPPECLVKLISLQLKTRAFGYQHKKPQPKLNAARKYVEECKADGRPVKAAEIAKAAKVNPKQPYRWRNEGLLDW